MRPPGSLATRLVAASLVSVILCGNGPAPGPGPDNVPTPAAASASAVVRGVGVLGDSYSDEYQFYPPDRTTARNWVEILATTRGLNFGPFSNTSRGEPRNQGYAFNWARSDATTDDLIRTGQHQGLADQVSRGEVSTAVVFIGGNDFIYALQSADPLAALGRTVPRVHANYRKAIDTLRAAGPELRLVLITLPDIRNLPEFATPLRSGTLAPKVADAYTAAIDQFNLAIRSRVAADRRAVLVDFDLATRVSNKLSRDRALVAGRWLDRLTTGNAPHQFFLGDRRHMGTIGQGLLAQMVVEALDARFQAGIPRLTSFEIGRLADAQSVIASSGSRP